MKKQFVYDESGIRTGVLLSIEEYNRLIKVHQNSLESINEAKAKLDAYLQFYSLDTDLKKFKETITKGGLAAKV